MNDVIQKMHGDFCRITGQTLTLSYQRQWSWAELVKRGYGSEEVTLVVRWIKAQMGKAGSGYSPASLQFSRLIQDADIFEDRLNLARKAFPRQRRETTHETPKKLIDLATDAERESFLKEIQSLRKK